MKRMKPILLLCMFLAFVGTSCKKSGTNPTNSVSISLKFNGTVKTSNVVTTDYIKSEGTLQVIGKFGNEGVSFLISGIKVGTFDVANGDVLATYSTTADFNNSYIASTGTIIISSFSSTNVTGTFSFAGTTIDGRNGTVTEGKFSAKVITQ